MMDGPVLYRRRDGIVTLTLNRPETLNAMNEAMMGEMERILIELEADTAVRAVTARITIRSCSAMPPLWSPS